MDIRKTLREMAALLNTNIENIPSVLNRFKKEADELENKLRQ